MVSQDNIAIYDTDDFPARKDGKDLCETRANIVAATRLPDAPLASLLLLAYNRLEKTKLCIESILKYTSDIDYELILFDNGSTDGTFEYFMSLEHPRKKIVRVTKNHTRLIPECVTLTARYIVGVNNDIVVTRNWLSNLIKCAESDCRIGMIVPAMSNVSNVQEVDLQFNSLDDMQKKAAAFNVSDPGKWHERLRLVTPLYFIKKECADLVGLGDYGIGQFMDDDWIFNLRHAGYKAVLCKDTFVHHNHDFRNSEDRDADEFEKLLLKGRESFRAKHYGVDAWDDVNNYELNMIEMVKQPTRSGTVEILGIDVRCGTPILEVKNRLRGFGVFSPRLSALSEDSKYYLDLKTICEGDVFCAKVEDLRECFENRRFNYIVLGAPLNMYNHPLKLLKVLLGLLTEKGQLLLKVRNTFDICTMVNSLGSNQRFYDNHPRHMSIESVSGAVASFGGTVKEIRAEPHNVEKATVDQFSELVKKAKLSKDIKKTLTKLFAENYVLDIVPGT